MKGAHHLMRAETEIEQTRQKSTYDYPAYGPAYSEWEQVFVSFRGVREREIINFTPFFEG